MFDQSHNAIGHELSGPHGCPGARDLGHLDHAPRPRDLDAPARLGRLDLIREHAIAGVHHDFDAVTSHTRNVLAVADAR